ncbi:asialoglycoprotein receptor 1 isoform X7 [Tursiops truncatus]|uniref:asialoglycoprotein receptor 1 isoform X7 n=1 Tax=Tursiops truncatus TaxID=9739 RepID=UPI003CCFC735
MYNVPPSRLEEAQTALLLGPQSCPRLLMPSPLAGPPPPHSLFRRLCSGPSLILISIGLSLLLLVVVCVIGSQNSKLQEELRALRETFSNLTVSTEAKVKALSVQGGNVGRKMKSLESQLEKQQQDLSEDHSSLLLHVKQFVSDLRSLSCQMAVLQGNGTGDQSSRTTGMGTGSEEVRTVPTSRTTAAGTMTSVRGPTAMPPGTEPPQCEQKQHPQLGNKYNKCKGEPTTQNHQHGRKTNTMEEKTTANRIHNPDGS